MSKVITDNKESNKEVLSDLELIEMKDDNLLPADIILKLQVLKSKSGASQQIINLILQAQIANYQIAIEEINIILKNDDELNKRNKVSEDVKSNSGELKPQSDLLIIEESKEKIQFFLEKLLTSTDKENLPEEMPKTEISLNSRLTENDIQKIAEEINKSNIRELKFEGQDKDKKEISENPQAIISKNSLSEIEKSPPETSSKDKVKKILEKLKDLIDKNIKTASDLMDKLSVKNSEAAAGKLDSNSSFETTFDDKQSQQSLKKINPKEAEKIVKDIFSTQISGHQSAITKIQEKIDSLSAEDNIEEIKMLNELKSESEKKIEKLEQKNQDSNLIEQISKEITNSYEMESYQNFDERRRSRFLMPKVNADSLSVILGGNDIQFEIVKMPIAEFVGGDQLGSQNLVNEIESIASDYSQDQVSQGQANQSKEISVIRIVNPIEITESKINSNSLQRIQLLNATSQATQSSNNFTAGSNGNKLSTRPVVGLFTQRLAQKQQQSLISRTRGG